MKSKYKILIVDDERNYVEILRERLESVGYETVVAYEGLRAVEAAHKDKPNLIILDWKMPLGKGGVVLEYLREKDDTRHIPVIIVTGVDDQEIEDAVDKYHVKAVYFKPYDIETLLSKIREVLEWEKARSKINE